MPGGAYTTYASDLSEAAQGAVLSYASPAYTQTSAGTTPYMQVVAPQGMNLLGIYVYASAVVTPSSSTSVVSGSDLLDIINAGYEVTNAIGGGARCKTISRKGTEEAERLFIQSPQSTTAPFTYPRATTATFTATNVATTIPIRFIVPAAGGTAAQIRFAYPGAGNAYSTTSSITSISVTYFLYAIPTLSNVNTAYSEVQTPALGTAQNDLSPYIPPALAPDLCEIIGVTWSSSTIAKIVVDGQGGIGRTVDFEDVVTPNDLQLLYPPTVTSNDQLNCLFNMHGLRADHLWVTTGGSYSGGLDMLFCQMTAEDTLTAAPVKAQTPSPNLSGYVAGTASTGLPVPMGTPSGVTRSPPASRRTA